MRARFTKSFALSLSLALCSSIANAERWVETVGSAPIVNGATGLAREYAIRDALRLAVLQTKAYINSTSVASNNVLVIDNASLNTAGKVDDMKIVSEWVDDDFLFVRIRAQVDEKADTAPSPAARYRKRIALMQFDTINRRDTHDLPHFETQYPKELLTRLENSDQFIGIDATKMLLTEAELNQPAIAQKVISMAEQLGVQIIVAGIVRDLGVVPGVIFDDRNAEIDIHVFDGISGTRIARQRFSEKVTYTGHEDASRFSLSNANIGKSRFTKALDRILEAQTALIARELKSIPFSARVIRADKEGVVINAGVNARIEVGDTLMAYRVEIDPYVSGSQKSQLGYKETPVASLSVTQVQPQFSIGKLEIDGKLYAGDIIRFGY